MRQRPYLLIRDGGIRVMEAEGLAAARVAGPRLGHVLASPPVYCSQRGAAVRYAQRTKNTKG